MAETQTQFTTEEQRELARLEHEFDEAGGFAFAEPRYVKDDGSPAESLMDGRFNYKGGNDRFERICELREKRGDATMIVRVKAYMQVKLRGSFMSRGELAEIIGPPNHALKLEEAIRSTICLTDRGDITLGYTPDGNREAFVDELIEVEYVEEVER
jgi:hypothetical protein